MALKMNEPVGDAMYGPLLIRVSLGAYFILAGFLKFENLPAFIQQVQQYNILPMNMARLYGTLLPYLEIGCGFLLIIGFWTTMASIICSLLLLSFVIALKLFPNANDLLFNKDVILLCASLSLMYTGAGAASIDRFRRVDAGKR